MEAPVARGQHPSRLAPVAKRRRWMVLAVVIVGIPFQDKPAAATAYMTELGGDWPQLLDPGERTALAYGVYGVPETYVVGPDGRVAFKRVGVVTYPMLTEQIGRLLPGSG